MNRLKRRVKRFAGDLVRRIEPILPIPVLILLLLPFAVARATYEWFGRSYLFSRSSKRRALFEAVRNSDRRRHPLGTVWRGHLSLCMARCFRLWPDRLHERRWKNRCTFVGKEQFDAALATGRPILLITVHFASLTELFHWLRAQGHATAFFVTPSLQAGDTSYRDNLESLADEAIGLKDVPRRFTPDQTWEARDFLSGGNRILGIAMDARHPRSILARGNVFGVHFMTGGLRLAPITNAIVVPCLIRATWCLRCEIHFGVPVPDELLESRKRDVQVMEHVLRDLSPWIAANPEQCAPHLIAALELDNPVVSRGES